MTSASLFATRKKFSAQWLRPGGAKRSAKSAQRLTESTPINSRAPATRRCDDGFALLIVLWTLVLIASVVAHLISAGRTEIQIAKNLVANAGAQAAADGAIFEAIFNQSDPLPDRRWPVDGRPRELVVGSYRVSLRLENEAWWINPSLAPPALLEALLQVTGTDPGSADRVANAISEWVGSVSEARRQDQVFTDYRKAGLNYGPPNAPVEDLDELGLVVGMTPDLLSVIRPHLTLFGPAQPSASSPDPVVAAALAEAATAAPVPLASDPPPDVLTTRITATAFGINNARVKREAVIRFGPVFPCGYEMLAWPNGS